MLLVVIDDLQSSDHKNAVLRTTQLGDARKAHVRYTYYSFLEAYTISKMAIAEVETLERLHCFDVPSRPAMDEFVRQYFLHIHPHLPLLDEGDFWEAYSAYNSPIPRQSRLSLFVFQAMMLVASSVCPCFVYIYKYRLIYVSTLVCLLANSP